MCVCIISSATVPLFVKWRAVGIAWWVQLLFSNRSATLHALNKFERALEDAEQAIALAPAWPKVRTRTMLTSSRHLPTSIVSTGGRGTSGKRVRAKPSTAGVTQATRTRQQLRWKRRPTPLRPQSWHGRQRSCARDTHSVQAIRPPSEQLSSVASWEARNPLHCTTRKQT